MTNFIYQEQDPSGQNIVDVVYTMSGLNHPSFHRQVVTRKTKTQVTAANVRFNLETGREIGGSKYYGSTLITKERFLTGKNKIINDKILNREKELKTLQERMRILMIEIENLQKTKSSIGG